MPIRFNVCVIPRLRAAAVFACALAGFSMPAAAAPKAPKPPPPVYTPPSAADPADAPATKPVDKAAEVLPAGLGLAEGAYVSERVGRLDHEENSPFAQLTFPPASASSQPTAVAVAPNLMLRAMEESAGERAADFRVSGTVTMYRGRNLLVIDTAAPSGGAPANATAPVAAAPPSAAAPAAPAPTTRPSTNAAAPAPASERNASAEQLLGQMLKSPPKPGGADSGGQPLRKPETPPETDATSGKGAVKPGAPSVAVLREGTYLVDRLGRLTRSADGTTAEFTFESDGSALQDPPVVIIPNLKLMAMEDAANAINRDLRFRITGMVTEYRGRNYVLLEKAVVVPDATQQLRRTQE